jgi:hypothetical protein
VLAATQMSVRKFRKNTTDFRDREGNKRDNDIGSKLQ